MISLKRYLDSAETQLHKPEKDSAQSVSFALLSAYRSALAEIGECSANACPDLVSELKRQLTRLDEDLGDHPGVPAITMTSEQLHELLKGWGNKTAEYYQQRAAEVKDLLLVMARTAESLGHNGDRYTHQLDSVTAQLETISKLEDVTRIRTSVEESARQLKISIARMTAESKAVMDHLRVEVSTYRAKLEKAENLASCDALTGLGSRLWAEAQIQQRIEIGNPFCVLMIDVHGFRRVNQEYGNMVGDLIMKEFARELRSSCRFSDLVARWAGDEFLVVLDCAAADATAQIARLQSWICKPYQVPGRSGHVSVQLSTKIGIAESRQGDSMPEILDRADAALCAVREQTRNQVTALG
jgi:diguanylate cyclase (GGDEF)-like protein